MDKDLRQLRSLIREALGRSPLPARSLEDELGIGHGNLAHLLSGQLELKVRHLLSISRLLDVPPHRLIELGCPEALAASTRDVTDLVAATAPASGIAHLTLDALEERIRAIVRDELAAQAPAPKTARR
ncbi:MAG TPA: hypothetical protein VH988_24040 [Thermoanaerobaculia bacterium]|jgi:hypothetical protein|nr:hypothetical protein [Thermoanaerobaculia bacterium]